MANDSAGGRPTAANTARLSIGDKSWDFAVKKGSVGPDVIDISSLYGTTGRFTYDPGFTSTANCSSKITYIDGDEGVLLYRGYPIDQLAEKSNFVEVCYLLLNGELPTKGEFEKFRHTITHHTMVHEQMTRFYTGFRRDAHPMAVMCGVVGALSALGSHIVGLRKSEPTLEDVFVELVGRGFEDDDGHDTGGPTRSRRTDSDGLDAAPASDDGGPDFDEPGTDTGVRERGGGDGQRREGGQDSESA